MSKIHNSFRLIRLRAKECGTAREGHGMSHLRKRS